MIRDIDSPWPGDPPDTSSDAETVDCLIVGSGIAGLCAARALADAGRQVVLLDKGRQVGGRMATRRLSGAADAVGHVDHGAQFFTVREPEFAALVRDWVRQDIVSEWCTGFAEPAISPAKTGHPRYRGTRGMNGIARHLAEPLDARLQKTVERVEAGHDQWRVTLTDEQQILCRDLLLTPPVPQTLKLLDQGGLRLPSAARAALNKITYDPCLAVLAVLEGPSRIPAPGAVRISDGPVAWIADNRQKGISPEVYTVTLHASAEFSRAHFDNGRRAAGHAMLEAAHPWIGSPVLSHQVHGWRYSTPIRVHENRYLAVQEGMARVVFAGDAFGGPRVEGAALSGLAAAAYLLDSAP